MNFQFISTLCASRDFGVAEVFLLSEWIDVENDYVVNFN